MLDGKGALAPSALLDTVRRDMKLHATGGKTVVLPKHLRGNRTEVSVLKAMLKNMPTLSATKSTPAQRLVYDIAAIKSTLRLLAQQEKANA